MKNKLSRLFDRQLFQHNSRLDKIVSESESRYAGILSEDDLELVSAAGEAIDGSKLIMNVMFDGNQNRTHEMSEALCPEGSKR